MSRHWNLETRRRFVDQHEGRKKRRNVCDDISRDDGLQDILAVRLKVRGESAVVCAWAT